MAGVHSNLSPMRYVVGHFLHASTYILLTRVQLFIDKPRPFAQIEIDAGAHEQIFTACLTRPLTYNHFVSFVRHLQSVTPTTMPVSASWDFSIFVAVIL